MERGNNIEYSEEKIIAKYKLSKRKEHAFTPDYTDKLTDDNIKIFCGDVDPA